MPFLLLLLIGLASSFGLGLLGILLLRTFKRADNTLPPKVPEMPGSALLLGLSRPSTWLAVQNRSLAAVQVALGLRDARPCSLSEGLASGTRLFISPPLKGWVLVFGSELPDPGEDVDVCYRLLVELSRKLGRIQYFWCDRAVSHHGWVMAERGKILRAYAWAGHTLWKQGARTQAERELDLRCLDYGEDVERTYTDPAEWTAALNVEKVPVLAARWSVDPAHIEESALSAPAGLAGEATLRY